jgi:hypothetical protein
MTVPIYVDTSKKVGDVDHIVFANEDAAEKWFAVRKASLSNTTSSKSDTFFVFWATLVPFLL